jgi:hypothetical protein
VQVKSWNGNIDNANWIEYLATPGTSRLPVGAACHLQRRRRRGPHQDAGSDDLGARVTVPAGTTALGSGPTTAITIGLTKWSEMAIDSGNFRNWAGIHFVDVNRHGVKVGHNALDKASSYWS